MIKRRGRRGATLVEMTLVGIPLMFILISVFEMSRGMWMYHTLAYAVKEGVRFAIVHGQNCVSNPPDVTNSCIVYESDIATQIQNAGVGLDPTATQLTFCTGTCASGTTPTCYMNACSSTTQWPPTGSNQTGQTIEIDIITPFHSALAMFWPGQHHVSFAKINLGASSSDTIAF